MQRLDREIVEYLRDRDGTASARDVEKGVKGNAKAIRATLATLATDPSSPVRVVREGRYDRYEVAA